jgi:hypothetical protein
VQEGLVFVSMSSEDLIKRTSAFQVKYPQNKIDRPPYNPRPIYNARQPRRPSQIQGWGAGYERRMQTQRARAAQVIDVPETEHNVLDLGEDDSDHVITDDPDIREYPTLAQPENGISGYLAPSTSSFTITQEDSDDNGNGSAPDDDANRAEIQSRLNWRERAFDDEEMLALGGLVYSRALPIHTRRPQSQPALVSLMQAEEISNLGNNAAEDTNPDQPALMPHTRFFIKPTKSKISLQFDPPM